MEFPKKEQETPTFLKEEEKIKKELGQYLTREAQVLQDNPKRDSTEGMLITQEFVDSVIQKENRRYKSEEALTRAKKIDMQFPPTLIEKTFNKYKSQEKNLEFVGSNPHVIIADYLPDNAGGFYRKQPALVPREKDFIEVAKKAKNPEDFENILVHEYNHLFTQGLSNFSSKYQSYIRNIFWEEKELLTIGKNPGSEILLTEPFDGAGPVYKYLTNPAEVSAYLNTNLRNDLLRNGRIENFYDTITLQMLAEIPTLKNTHATSEKTPIYKIYLLMTKDKDALLEWLNNYAI